VANAGVRFEPHVEAELRGIPVPVPKRGAVGSDGGGGNA
jgi:hypothetical protein